MRDLVGDKGAVVEEGAVLVCENVDVRGATGVVAGEDGEPLGDTFVIGGLQTPEPGLVLSFD